MNKKKPNVSVVMITYNHEQFIKEAIDGVLMQDFDGEIELIIADDCSPDNTKSIVEKCIKANNNKKISIKYTKHKQNKGVIPNFVWALNERKGKYIALCEGDDYWTDPYKLQKQVDFLEANEEYSLVAHEVEIKYEDHFDREMYYTSKDLKNISDVSHFFYPTCSLVFKADIFNDNIFEITNSPGGDKLLMYNAFKVGKLKCLNEKMGVYRKNAGGVSYKKIITADIIKKEIAVYSDLMKYFNHKYDKHFRKLTLINYVKLLNLKNTNKLFVLLRSFKFISSINDLKMLIKDGLMNNKIKND